MREPAHVLVCLAATLLAGHSVLSGNDPTRQTKGPPDHKPRSAARRMIRATGVVQAAKTFTVQTPQIQGQGGQLTLVRLVASGAMVKEGDLLAEFDTTRQADAARDLEAKVEDLGHQIEQKKAETRAGMAKRRAELREAEAELARAQIQMRKGPLLPEIDRLKAEVSADLARQRIESLKKSQQARDRAEAGALRVLELQTDRQKVGLQRARSNLERLRVRAPIAGMVALQNTWRSGSIGPAQEGDQLYSGQALLRIFDPASVVVEAQVNQADGSRLRPGAKARVRLDAYPEMEYDAVLEFASPVAAAALDSPIRFFPARFRLITKPAALGGQETRGDARVLPDLSAAVEIEAEDL